MKRRTFIVGASTAALTVAGYKASKYCRTLFSQEPAVSKLADLDETKPIDACILGSGPAGCILAEQLVAKGLSVAMFESGVQLTDTEGMQHIAGLDKYVNSGKINYPIQASRFRAVGGTSNLWTGRCPRLLPSDFDENPLSPKGGWPISYQELQSYYQLAEKRLRVTGDTLTAGQAPRESDLPYRSKLDISPLKSILAPLDIRVDIPPTSMANHTSGPVRFNLHSLSELSQKPNFTLYTDATATLIESGNNGEITGIQIKNYDGLGKKVRAEQYIIACGAIESARLLLLSKSSAHPQGIGNQSDHLGRYFMEHPALGYEATLPGKPFRKFFKGRTFQFCDTLNQEGFGKFNLGFYAYTDSRMKIAIGLEMSPERNNRVTLNETNPDVFGNPGAALQLSLSDRDRALLDRGEKMVKDIFKQLNSGQVKPTTTLDALHWSHHHMGTTRMSADPAEGVVDQNLKVYGTNNLYVASSSVFVTCGAANPTLTISALSYRLADHILAT